MLWWSDSETCLSDTFEFMAYLFRLTRSGSDSDFVCRFIPGRPAGGLGGIRFGGAGIFWMLVCTLLTGSVEFTLGDWLLVQNLYRYRGRRINRIVTTNITTMTIENIIDWFCF